MKNNKVTSVVGFAWLLLWISYIPLLVSQFPFQEHEGVKSLVEEVSKAPDFIKKESSLLNRTSAELEDSLIREIRIIWIKNAAILFLGLVAAFLLIKKKRSGRILALSLATGFLLLKSIYFVKYFRIKLSFQYLHINLQHFPMQTIQGIVATVIMILTIILLLRSYIIEPNEPVHSDAPEDSAAAARISPP
jgi:hypothetical protein